ncbi:MAG: type VI secretion system baseplate subunit TssE [Desulfovibrionaceae bacterium]|nr:type VI secretion system baseplate subunit TssE [Desulfovibrionaceae bacterium]
MAGIRFLERLSRMQHEAERRDSTEAEEVLQSVTGYVAKLLNTRHGSTVLDDAFGIADFSSNGVSFENEDIPRLEREIADFIARYEPRLTDVHVRFTPDTNAPLQMVFSLKAELQLTEESSLPVHLVTRVNPLGKVTITA